MKITKLLAILALSVFLMTSCEKDEPMPTPTPDAPISSFQFEIDAADFLKVVFSNFSQNATSYAWDFGDGNSSTEENPTHSYAAGGDYTVTLTASNGTESRESSKTITITDPNQEVKKITGESGKVWKLSRNTDEAEAEFPLIVGPEDRSQIWWSLGGVDQIADRPCMMEEEYIFNVDGSFTYDPKGEVWAEGGVWNDNVAGGCVDASVPENMTGPNGEDLSAWGPGDFTFDFDAANGTLTLEGLGAHVGLAKVGTNAEVLTPQNAVTYKIVKLETDGPIDKLSLETTIDGGYWQFNLVSYDDPNDEPGLGAALPVAGFTLSVDQSTASFENTSTNADSYLWDFGDGNTSTEENPTHTYSGDGCYTVTLTATNSEASSVASSTIIISVNSFFDAETLTGSDAKTWKLNPQAGALAVGPGIGSGEWWANTIDDVDGRACTFDDEYTFRTNGEFQYDATGEVWAEAYMGVDPAGCIAEDMLSEDASAWASGLHSFEVEVGENGDPSFVTVNGIGAFIGLPKAYNGGEYQMAPPTESSVRYQVFDYVKSDTNEKIILAVDIAGDGTAWWTFTLVSE